MCNYVAYNRFYKRRFLHLFTKNDCVCLSEAYMSLHNFSSLRTSQYKESTQTTAVLAAVRVNSKLFV